MKKNKLLLALIFIIVCMLQTCIFAGEDISIFIDGSPKVFNPAPIIQNGTTLVPMRDCFETLGCRIYWQQSTKTATAIKDNINIKVIIGKNEAFINNNKIYISVVPQIIGESTYVPLRFVSESLGADVSWDNGTRTITINNKIEDETKKYTLIDSQNYEIKTTYLFYNNGDKINAEFDILIGAMSNSPYQNDYAIDIIPNPTEIYDDDYGNKYAKINLSNIQKGENIQIITKKKLLNSGIKYDINQANIQNDYSDLDDYEVYINPQVLTESDNPLIIEKANELSKNENNPYLITKNIFEFVNKYLIYDTSDTYARKGALNALVTGRGLCEDYSKLFVALMRANNIPSRSVFGYWINEEVADKINSENWYDLSETAHEWPEFYLQDYGWVIAEPTFFYSYNNEQVIPWNQFANQDMHGHIIFGYEPDTENALTWRVEGYNELDLQYKSMKTEIKKIK